MTCRWPHKQRHQSRGAAYAAIKALERDGKGNPDYTPYLCEGHWHIGHDVRHFTRRIRRALRRSR